MIKLLLCLFTVLSALGLLFGVGVHLTSIFGLANPAGDLTWLLHAGVVGLAIPAIGFSRALAKRGDGQVTLRDPFNNWPVWMKIMTYLFFGYAMVNFLLLAPQIPRGKQVLEDGNPIKMLRLASGHWMALYSMWLSVFCSELRLAVRRG